MFRKLGALRGSGIACFVTWPGAWEMRQNAIGSPNNRKKLTDSLAFWEAPKATLNAN